MSSSPPAENSKFKTIRECSDSTMRETILGGVVVVVFVMVWISSLASPLLLYFSIGRRDYITSTIILALTAGAYLPWKKGPFCQLIQESVEKYHPRYYRSAKIIFYQDALPQKDDSSNKKQRLLYCVHPHGIVSLGWSTLFTASFMSKVRFCFSPVLYASPFFLFWSRVTGNPGKADKTSMHSYMNKEELLALPVGGFEEATITCQTKDRVYIKHRAGFIKLCLQHGYTIVPIYCFGERCAFWNLQGCWNFRVKKLNKLGIPAVFAWGRWWWMPFLPYRNLKFLIVAGEPISCPKIDKPSKEDVKVWHEKYMAGLLRIFEEYKVEAYGEEVGKAAKLEVW